jgi:NADH-quinone oxidoreductase subunit L
MHHNLDEVILRKDPSILSHDTEWILMGLAVASAAAVIYFAYMMYRKYNVLPAAKEEQMKPWQRLVYNKYYVDEIYDALIRKPLDLLSTAFHKIDVHVIDGVVNGVGSGVKAVGSGIRLLQQGNIGFYVIGMVVGIVFIVLLTFFIK